MKYIQETVVGQNGKNICPGAVSLLCHWSVRLMKLFFEKWLLTHVFGGSQGQKFSLQASLRRTSDLLTLVS